MLSLHGVLSRLAPLRGAPAVKQIATAAAGRPPKPGLKRATAVAAAQVAEQLSPVQQELDLPAASHSRVKTARFIKSSVKLEQCPKPGLQEFAVIGRSNVGKSSLINLLTGQSALAQVSKTPGGVVAAAHCFLCSTALA